MSDDIRGEDIRAAVEAFKKAQESYIKMYFDLVDICAEGSRTCGSDAGAAAFLLLGRESGWREMVTERGDVLTKGGGLLADMMSKVDSVVDFLKSAPEGGVQ